MSPLERDRAEQMLKDARDAVQKHYYDPHDHGIDLNARYQEFVKRIQSIPDLNDGMRMVASFLSGLHDSHTYFIPLRPYHWEYGFRIQLFGNTGFIERIRPGTDAASKLQVGDQVLGFDGYEVNRKDFHDLWYNYDTLMPQTRVRLDVRDPDGKVRRVFVNGTFRSGQNVVDFTSGADIWKYQLQLENQDHRVRQRDVEMGDIMVWKMPEFLLRDGQVDHWFDIARKHKALILDLRGNPGGRVKTLERMVGNIIDHDVMIATPLSREKIKPIEAKPVRHVFSGKLIVLVDSESASAAELFARVVQLEHRGTVIGDRTSGSVMEAKGYRYSLGIDRTVRFGFSVTEADLIMKDGQSLEHVGVTPDDEIIPTAQDLARGRDPVLAAAVRMAGGKITAANAGKMFPFEWLPR